MLLLILWSVSSYRDGKGMEREHTSPPHASINTPNLIAQGNQVIRNRRVQDLLKCSLHIVQVKTRNRSLDVTSNIPCLQISALSQLK